MAHGLLLCRCYPFKNVQQCYSESTSVKYFKCFAEFSVESNAAVDVDGLAGHGAGLIGTKE